MKVEATRLMRLMFLVVLSAVLVVLSVIDIDDDPTTTNLPSVVLSCFVDLDAERPAGRSESPPEETAAAMLWARLRRRLHRWVNQRGQELHLHSFFIRGP